MHKKQSSCYCIEKGVFSRLCLYCIVTTQTVNNTPFNFNSQSNLLPFASSLTTYMEGGPHRVIFNRLISSIYLLILFFILYGNKRTGTSRDEETQQFIDSQRY